MKNENTPITDGLELLSMSLGNYRLGSFHPSIRMDRAITMPFALTSEDILGDKGSREELGPRRPVVKSREDALRYIAFTHELQHVLQDLSLGFLFLLHEVRRTLVYRFFGLLKFRQDIIAASDGRIGPIFYPLTMWYSTLSHDHPDAMWIRDHVFPSFRLASDIREFYTSPKLVSIWLNTVDNRGSIPLELLDLFSRIDTLSLIESQAAVKVHRSICLNEDHMTNASFLEAIADVRDHYDINYMEEPYSSQYKVMRNFYRWAKNRIVNELDNTNIFESEEMLTNVFIFLSDLALHVPPPQWLEEDVRQADGDILHHPAVRFVQALGATNQLFTIDGMASKFYELLFSGDINEAAGMICRMPHLGWNTPDEVTGLWIAYYAKMEKRRNDMSDVFRIRSLKARQRDPKWCLWADPLGVLVFSGLPLLYDTSLGPKIQTFGSSDFPDMKANFDDAQALDVDTVRAHRDVAFMEAIMGLGTMICPLTKDHRYCDNTLATCKELKDFGSELPAAEICSFREGYEKSFGNGIFKTIKPLV